MRDDRAPQRPAVRPELGEGLDRLSAEVATAAYRIVQEALGNVVRHAGAHERAASARRSSATSSSSPSRTTAGGFGPGTLGHGVEGMIERARMVAGRLDLESPAGGGARVRFEMQHRPRVIRALLVDDHQIVRSGVRRVLEATGRFDVVGEAGGVDEALGARAAAASRRRGARPALRDGSGLDVIADLRESGARVVILSMQDEPAYARKAFELGAQGYVVKDAADEELADAIDAVLADRIYVHPAIAARLVMREPEDELTERERQILRLIALGYTNQEIAGQLS